ncbi:MAG: hypothetical protein J7K72_01615 [Candidatus Aenigmarchaeota archaeon]|nr:hypothetical protein [Candidatus Aenigmarchaeota archaeon]
MTLTFYEKKAIEFITRHLEKTLEDILKKYGLAGEKVTNLAREYKDITVKILKEAETIMGDSWLGH